MSSHCLPCPASDSPRVVKNGKVHRGKQHIFPCDDGDRRLG
ncbi:hypothetical protein [Halomicronema sp. CCY15110]|nr:hypothetical protein [Halomicronema sp. CCY15110]